MPLSLPVRRGAGKSPLLRYASSRLACLGHRCVDGHLRLLLNGALPHACIVFQSVRRGTDTLFRLLVFVEAHAPRIETGRFAFVHCRSHRKTANPCAMRNIRPSPEFTNDSGLEMAVTSVLIVEDDTLIAFSLAQDIEYETQAEVVVATTLKTAEQQLTRQFDFAILDVNLGGETSFALARQLLAQNVACVFASGSSRKMIPDDLQHVPFLVKPCRIRLQVDRIRAFPVAPPKCATR